MPLIPAARPAAWPAGGWLPASPPITAAHRPSACQVGIGTRLVDCCLPGRRTTESGDFRSDPDLGGRNCPSTVRYRPLRSTARPVDRPPFTAWPFNAPRLALVPVLEVAGEPRHEVLRRDGIELGDARHEPGGGRPAEERDDAAITCYGNRTLPARRPRKRLLGKPAALIHPATLAPARAARASGSGVRASSVA